MTYFPISDPAKKIIRDEIIKPILCITSAKLKDIYIKRGGRLLSLTYSHDFHGYDHDDYGLNDCDLSDYVLNGYVIFFYYYSFIKYFLCEYFKRFHITYCYGHDYIFIHVYAHVYDLNDYVFDQCSFYAND